MTTDTALIEKREELKRRLAAGEYKTLVDVFLAWFDRLVRKIIRRSRPLPTWHLTIILILTIIMVSFIVVYTAGDLGATSNHLQALGASRIAMAISVGTLAIFSPIEINNHIRRTILLWQHNIIDITESTSSLDDFEDWLKKTCNWRLCLLVTIVGGLVGGLYFVTIISAQLGIFVGYGVISTYIILSMFSTAFIYLLLAVVLLSARLRQYDLKLFAADPSSSELVSRLSGELNFLVYFVSFYAAIVTLLFAWGGFLQSFVIILLPGLWLPISTMFILNQTSLSSIIRRAKWKTLNEIQAKVEKLQVSNDFGNQETMEAIKRLMDYHDRVKATRDSALDFRAYLSFINSLLLPLLAFILGNLDLVLKLFGRNP